MRVICIYVERERGTITRLHSNCCRIRLYRDNESAMCVHQVVGIRLLCQSAATIQHYSARSILTDLILRAFVITLTIRNLCEFRISASVSRCSAKMQSVCPQIAFDFFNRARKRRKCTVAWRRKSFVKTY